MSNYDFTAADDAALTARVTALIERIEARIGNFGERADAELMDAWALLRSYHDELIMRRQECRALVLMVDTLGAAARMALA